MPRQTPNKPGYLCVGVIAGAHGIRGEVRVASFLEHPEKIMEYGVPTDEVGTPFSIEKARVTPKGLLVKFAHVPDRTAAEQLRGTHLFVPLENLPELAPEDGVYYAQLVGMQALLDDEPIGVVHDVFDSGAQTVLVVARPDGTEALLLYADDFLTRVDVPSKKIIFNENIRPLLELAN